MTDYPDTTMYVLDAINAELDGARIGGQKMQVAVGNALARARQEDAQADLDRGVLRIEVNTALPKEQQQLILAAREAGLVAFSPGDSSIYLSVVALLVRACLPYGLGGVLWQRRFGKIAHDIIEALRLL